MRLHSVRFKHMTTDPGDGYALSVIVRDLMTTHGCYLQKCYDTHLDQFVWYARYE